MTRSDGGRRPLAILGLGAAAVAGAAGLAVGALALRHLHRGTWRRARAARAGFTEKQATVNGVRLNYGEGPPGGVPLLLVHGQGSDWKSYAGALPALAPNFHVFAVDVHGHGGSERTPGRYRAQEVAEDLAAFVEEVVGEPVVVSGHSSGGQLAALLAARWPERVRAVMLEDPPMLTTLLPRARDTWNWRDLATSCHEFLEGDEEDFVAHYWRNQLMWKFFGDGADSPRQAGLKRRERHPDEPLQLWWWPANEFLRSLENYDPRFGDAFHTGRWDEGFDHEETLRAITQPTVFVHTKVSWDGDLLQAATSDDDARRIVGMLADVEFVKADTGHDFHGEDPSHFVRLVEDLAQRG